MGRKRGRIQRRRREYYDPGSHPYPPKPATKAHPAALFAEPAVAPRPGETRQQRRARERREAKDNPQHRRPRWPA